MTKINEELIAKVKELEENQIKLLESLPTIIENIITLIINKNKERINDQHVINSNIANNKNQQDNK
tara:strand:+ start:446 stop:643 length:198 start_codon:yes stop_codon:yes gene_type:complete